MSRVIIVEDCRSCPYRRWDPDERKYWCSRSLACEAVLEGVHPSCPLPTLKAVKKEAERHERD